MSDYENRVLANIEEFGCSVTSVFDPEGAHPMFTYSIGIARSAGAPEVIVVGLKSDLGLWLVNEYNRRVRAGEVFEFDRGYDGFLDGYEVRFGPVSEANRDEYMRSACWLHEGTGFPAVQMIWPARSGEWPEDADAPEDLRKQQLLLA